MCLKDVVKKPGKGQVTSRHNRLLVQITQKAVTRTSSKYQNSEYLAHV